MVKTSNGIDMMKSIQNFLQKPYLYILIVLIGTALKFVHLEENNFWEDEISVILHTSGISHDEYKNSLPVNTIVNKSYYTDLLALNSRDLDLKNQITGLTKMPQLSPGHYYYLIFWVRLFGDNPMSFRYFTILCYFLSLVFLFLLVRLLFNSGQMGWIAVSLFALSPFVQIYTQEARYYILWAASIFIFNYVFLKAIRKQNNAWWIFYAITGFLTVHITLLNFALLALHFIYYMMFHRRNIKAILVSQSAILLSAIPWLIYLFLNRFAITEGLVWQQHPVFGEWHFWPLVKNVFSSFTHILFMDPWYLESRFGSVKIYQWTIGLLVLISLIFLMFNASKKQRVLVLGLILSGAIIILTGDFFRKSFGSQLNKYHLMVLMGILMLAAYGFNLLREKKPILFIILFPLVLAGGYLSSLNLARDFCYGKQGDCWWQINEANELYSGTNKVLIITDHELMISDWFPPTMALLNISENPNLDILYLKPEYPTDLCDKYNLTDYDNVYLRNMSPELKTYIDSIYTNKIEILRDEKMFGSIDLPLYELSIDSCHVAEY